MARFDLLDEAAATAFDGLVSETAPKISANEPGTLIYAVHEVEGAPLSRIFYELYADRAAFEAHEEREQTKRFLAEREQYISDLRVEFLEPPIGKGVAHGY